MDDVEPVLVGVDLGLRTGVAVYGRSGRLRRYSSTHLGSRSTLRRASAAILRDAGTVAALVMEGDRTLARIWERAATRHGAEVWMVTPETWRACLLLPREREPAAAAKQAAQRLAVSVITWSRQGAESPPNPHGPLRHDTADAIMVGLFGVLRAGWLDPDQLPFTVPG